MDIARNLFLGAVYAIRVHDIVKLYFMASKVYRLSVILLFIRSICRCLVSYLYHRHFILGFSFDEHGLQSWAFILFKQTTSQSHKLRSCLFAVFLWIVGLGSELCASCSRNLVLQ